MTTRNQRLGELLAAKAHELFAAYGVTCTTAPEREEEEDQICAVLGFTGDHLHGSVIVVVSAITIAQSNPSPGSGSSAWASELTNQLLGRFKNELFRYSIDVTMSIPIVLTAMRVQPLPRHAFQPVHLAAGSGTMMLWLLAEGDAELAETPIGEPVAAEGVMMMF